MAPWEDSIVWLIEPRVRAWDMEDGQTICWGGHIKVALSCLLPPEGFGLFGVWELGSGREARDQGCWEGMGYSFLCLTDIKCRATGHLHWTADQSAQQRSIRIIVQGALPLLHTPRFAVSLF